MHLELIHTKRLGLELWVIRFADREIHTFLSERHARSRYELLRNKLTTTLNQSN